MPILDSTGLSAFLNRFCSFSDAVVRRLEHRYFASGRQRTTVTVSSQDQQATQGWSNVVIVIDDVSEVVFREGMTSCQVLSSGLYITWLDGNLWCDFSPYTSQPSSVEDLRRSDFYVVGKVLTWDVEQFSDQ